MSEEVEKKYNIVRSIGEECIQEDELKNLLAKKPTPICYDGFEPSGRMHIAQVSYHSVMLTSCFYRFYVMIYAKFLSNFKPL